MRYSVQREYDNAKREVRKGHPPFDASEQVWSDWLSFAYLIADDLGEPELVAPYLPAPEHDTLLTDEAQRLLRDIRQSIADQRAAKSE